MKNSRFSLRLLAFLLAFVALSAIVPLGGLALPAEAASAPLAAAAEGASVLEGIPKESASFLADASTQYFAEVKVGDEVLETIPYTMETQTLTPTVPVPHKKGYIGTWSPFTPQVGGTVISPVYTPIQYKATFMAGGEVVDVQTFTITDYRLERIPVPKKYGCFGRWEVYQLGSEDFVVEAVYAFNLDATFDDPITWCGLGIFLLILIPLLLLLLRRRKKKDKEEEAPLPLPAEEPTASIAEEPVEEIVVAAAEPVEATPEEVVEEKPVKKIVVPESERASAVAQALSTLEKDIDDDDMSTMLVMPDGRHVLIKYRKSFRARMIQSPDETKSYYSELKNYILSFEGVAASDSWNYESFANGRKQIAKINVSGKTVVLFLALDPATLDGSKYKYDDVGERKRFEKTPVKIKIRSPRSLKWAKELIDLTMEAAGRPFVALSQENFMDPYEEKEPLIARDLIQIVARDVETGAKVDEEEIVNLIANGARIEHSGEGRASLTEAEAEDDGVTVLPVLTDVTPEEATEMVEDNYAETHILHNHSTIHKGKLDIINIDTLNANYENGDTVTLESLIEKGLLPKSTGRLKVLARGHLTKALTVEADAFSLDAVKMILLTGGNAVLDD